MFQTTRLVNTSIIYSHAMTQHFAMSVSSGFKKVTKPRTKPSSWETQAKIIIVSSH